MPTIRQALQQAVHSLASLAHASPELEAQVLLCHLLNQPRSFLFAWPDKALTEREEKDYLGLIHRRRNGEPVAHITGIREFWSLGLKVTPDTLIPRPETELLVEHALEHVRKTTSPLIADLGTGSGAIALAIASERPDCLLHATDRSEAALRIAAENRCSLALENVEFHAGDWCRALPQGLSFDLILSNPPYIAANDRHLRQGDLPREPAGALISGADGLNDIRVIVTQAPHHLKPGGWLLLEHGFAQGAAVRELLQQAGFRHVRTHRDLSGHERVSEGQTARPDAKNARLRLTKSQ